MRIGRSNLEVLVAATLEASVLNPRRPPPSAEFLATMNQLSELAHRAYRDLVYETEGFVEYFWSSTVISEIATLNIGSRPGSRKKTRAIEDLRAILWVFSWAQCRLMLPGCCGFGTAVEGWLALHPECGVVFLKKLYAEWPFFECFFQTWTWCSPKVRLRLRHAVRNSSLTWNCGGAFSIV